MPPSTPEQFKQASAAGVHVLQALQLAETWKLVQAGKVKKEVYEKLMALHGHSMSPVADGGDASLEQASSSLAFAPIRRDTSFDKKVMAFVVMAHIVMAYIYLWLLLTKRFWFLLDP